MNMSNRIKLAAILGVVLLAGCGERPPITTVQLGYRGTGMEQNYNPRLQEKVAAAKTTISSKKARIGEVSKKLCDGFAESGKILAVMPVVSAAFRCGEWQNRRIGFRSSATNSNNVCSPAGIESNSGLYPISRNLREKYYGQEVVFSIFCELRWDRRHIDRSDEWLLLFSVGDCE